MPEDLSMDKVWRQNSIIGFCHEHASRRKSGKSTSTRKEQPRETNSSTFQPVQQGPTFGQNLSSSVEWHSGTLPRSAQLRLITNSSSKRRSRLCILKNRTEVHTLSSRDLSAKVKENRQKIYFDEVKHLTSNSHMYVYVSQLQQVFVFLHFS